ncbi:tigger transposable element-derived protein 6-like [Belonocnema kinseyi]|uniref:tigger transposable element-derived protein 6-like n=1 Tax=Belonocnema kinseyi TaxID=2817044 RepID=UPI00143D24D0|nr:tigger transposable element-derived protein 6-like [Belonocnema kinseyi]
MKKEVLDLIDKGGSQRKIAEAFSVAKSTVGNIGKNRSEVLRAWNKNCCSERKRKLRKTGNEELNNFVFEFFCKCRSIDISVSGPMLQSKAKEIAEKLGIEKFQASNGWLESFQRRHNINFPILCGESAAADLAPENQFNADEFELLYRQMSRKSLVVKGEKCAGGKLAKERLTVLACCSSTGEKLKQHRKFNLFHTVRLVNSAWQENSSEKISKCFQRSGFKERTEGIDEDEDVGLAEVINSFSPEIQNDVLSVDDIINADAELILDEEIPTASDDILESILQQKEHSDAECYDSDIDETVNDDSTPVPTHKEAPQYIG